MATSARSPIRWLAAPVVAIVFVLGVWVTGGLLTNDFQASMAFTGAWVALLGLACIAVGVRVRGLRVPVIGAFLVTAAVAGAYIAWTTLRDRVVHEQLTVGTHVARGDFRSLEHSSHGTASLVRARDGRLLLTLTRFSTSPGPDLRVRIVPGRSGNGGADGARDLGALKGNKGDQQYVLPAGLDLNRYTSVVIWCRAFSAGFARATLIAT